MTNACYAYIYYRNKHGERLPVSACKSTKMSDVNFKRNKTRARRLHAITYIYIYIHTCIPAVSARVRAHTNIYIENGVPVSRIDPRCFSCVVIDEIHFSIKVLRDVPPFRKRYLPIPSPWHISLRSKSIQNSLSPTSRQAHICAREHTLPVPHTRCIDGRERKIADVRETKKRDIRVGKEKARNSNTHRCTVEWR